MHHITHHVATIDAARYVEQYRNVPRFLAFCKQCNNYGRMWCCPPFDDDVERLTDGYEQVTVWGTVITFDQATRQACHSDAQRRQLSSQAIDDAWRQMLPFLHAQEAAHPGSRLFVGLCHYCRPCQCSRVDGKPCRHPELMRPSLEAVGFDVSATARDVLGIELQWSTDGRLPQRITLITALFTLEPIKPSIPTKNSE